MSLAAFLHQTRYTLLMPIPLTVLAILDGFGYSPNPIGNAINSANTPNLDYLWCNYPHFLLKAAEEEVGLEFGEIGNSEVGHITIGTGRVIPQSFNRINKAIQEGTFQTNDVLTSNLNQAAASGCGVHLWGIISTAGVHGHLFHYTEVMRMAASAGIKNLYLHLVLDGRDSGKFDSPMFLKEIEKVRKEIGVGSYVTVSGRAYSMDRNNNWDKTALAFQALMGQSPNVFNSPEEVVEKFYADKVDDENIPPCLIQTEQPVSLRPDDIFIMTNFREDRARQMAKALTLADFSGFDRGAYKTPLKVITLTEYESSIPAQVAFPFPLINNCLSDVLSANLISQIHIAETEKYAHVTYFFNGGREEKRPYEEFFMVPSLKPEEFAASPQMSAQQVTQAVLQSIDLGYNFIVFNFANGDMVGHTGELDATVKAIEVMDTLLKQIYEVVLARDGLFILTADHGNCEEMIDPQSGEVNKKHTIAPVPIILASNLLHSPSQTKKIMHDGTMAGLLSDVAPTILKTLNLEIPSEMTGAPLL